MSRILHSISKRKLKRNYQKCGPNIFLRKLNYLIALSEAVHISYIQFSGNMRMLITQKSTLQFMNTWNSFAITQWVHMLTRARQTKRNHVLCREKKEDGREKQPHGMREENFRMVAKCLENWRCKSCAWLLIGVLLSCIKHWMWKRGRIIKFWMRMLDRVVFAEHVPLAICCSFLRFLFFHCNLIRYFKCATAY